MDQSTRRLQSRLEKIWERPDFSLVFERFFKKTPHLVKKGSILFNEGDETGRLVLIKEGFVKLYKTSRDGKDTISYLYGPGYVLGVRALTSPDNANRHTAEALTNLKIITASHKEYLKVLGNNPEYLIDLIHIFISRLNYTERRLEGFITTDTTTRICIFLSDCARRFQRPIFQRAEKTKEKITIPIELTHQRIAEFVGALRETVTVSMNKLEKMGIIENNKGKITILDLKKLNNYSKR